jgi:uncharacterized cupredoxin-like copper-binding protein
MLRLENTGRLRHTFTAPEFFRAVAFRPGEAATEAEQSGGSLSLPAGEVEEIDLVPLQPGTYAVECTKPLHGLFGMTGTSSSNSSRSTIWCDLEAMRTLGSSQWS